jgi:iterative type I PKS product template protein
LVYDSCEDSVVAGELYQLDQLQSELRASGKKCAKVNVPYGYHADAMKPILSDLASLASQVKIHAPSIPIVSNVHGSVVAAGDASVFNPQYFARHCGESVKFEQGIHDLMSRDDFTSVSAWIEIGPHPTSLPMLRSIPATSQQAMYLPTLRKDTDDWRVVCETLAGLYCMNNTVKWRHVFLDLGPSARVADLPAYPFAKTRFWVQFQESIATKKNTAAVPTVSSTRYSLLDTCVQMPTRGSFEVARFETAIDRAASLIEGHKVSGHGLCPASVYMEMASAAAQLLFEHHGRMSNDSTISLSDLTFSNPLVYSPDIPRTIRIEITLARPGEKHAGRFEISSYVLDPLKTQLHSAGLITLSSKSRLNSKFGLVTTSVERRQKAMTESKHSEVFSTRTTYDIIFSRIVTYSPAYHAMKSITLDSNGVDAYAAIKLPRGGVTGNFVVHPIFMDTVLHAVGFLVNCNAGSKEAFICSHVGKVQAIPELIKADAEYGVYCNIGFMSGSMAVGDAYAYDLNTSTIVAVAKRIEFKKLLMSGFATVLASAVNAPSHYSSKTDATSQRHVVQQPKLSVSCSSPSFAGTVRQIKEIMGTVLGLPVKDLTEDKDLERLGLDSLTSIEARHALGSALGLKIAENLFTTCKTIGDICAALGVIEPPVPVSPPIPAASLTPPLSESTAYKSISENGGADRAPSLTKVKGVMASVLGIPVQDLDEDQDLERLGMDSLMSIEALHALTTTLGTKLLGDPFATCKTIRDLHAVVSLSLRSSPGASGGPVVDVPHKLKLVTYGTDTNPLLLQAGNGSSRAPLFLIHDGGGTAHHYGRISPLGRQVWGIHNPRFPAGGKWEGGLVEMARHYVELIKSKLDGARECVVGGMWFPFVSCVRIC